MSRTGVLRGSLWLVLLLFVASPGAGQEQQTAQAPGTADPVPSEATVDVSLELDINGFKAVGSRADCTVGGHFGWDADNRSFKFSEPLEEEACGEARYVLTLPGALEGLASRVKVSFQSDRVLFEDPPAIGLGVGDEAFEQDFDMVQTFLRYRAGSNVTFEIYDATAAQERRLLARSYSFDVGPGEQKVELGWFYHDRHEAAEGAPSDFTQGHGLGTFVVLPRAEIQSIPAAAQILDQDTTRLEDQEITEGTLSVLMPDAAPWRVDSAQVTVPAGWRVMAVATETGPVPPSHWTMTSDVGPGVLEIIWPDGAPSGPVDVTVERTVLIPLTTAPDPVRFYPVIFIAGVAPALASGVVGYSFARLQRLDPAFWSSLTRGTAAATVLTLVVYLATVAYAVAGVTMAELAVFPPPPASYAVYGLLLATTLAFLAIGLVNERLGRERYEVRREQDRIRKENTFKTQLLNLASHELNTPLTPIQAELQMLGSGMLGPLTQAQQQSIDVVGRNTDRLARMVREVLEANRLESGRLPVRPESMNLAASVDDAVAIYRATAASMDIKLSCSSAKNLKVEADPNRVMQILVNLIDNAVKFTPRGGSITVTARRKDTMALVEVADTGKGMTPGQLDRLFQPFSRVHEQEAPSTRGTGLGLFICRNLAQDMGGSLTATSAGVDQGSTFVVRLPLA